MGLEGFWDSFGMGFGMVWVAKSSGTRKPKTRVLGFRVPIRTTPNAALGVKASINANHALKNADRNYV